MTKRQEYINLFAFVIFISLMMFILKCSYFYFLIPLFVFLFGTTFPFLRKKILFAWIRFSYFLGSVNTRIILFLIFFMVLFPYALLFKRRIKGNYILRKTAQLESLFQSRNHAVVKSDFEKSW